MRRQKLWSAILILFLAALLTACRSSPPTLAPATLPISPTAPSDTPAPTQTQPIPTQVPPTVTPTPLPTWPDRWEPTGGPYGGSIQAIVIDPANPNTLYAAGAGGAVHKSNDGGETWTPGERLAPPSCPFSSLIVDAANPATLYAANTCAGVFKSSDAGDTWEHAGDDIEIKNGVALLIQSPHAPDLLLAAAHDGQVYRSDDGATTWDNISAGLPGEAIRSLAASGPNTYWATTANALYRFGAGQWAPLPFGQPPGTETSNVFVDPADPATLYLRLDNSSPGDAYLFRSTDGGFTWTPLLYQNNGAKNRVSILGQGQHSGLLYAADDGALLSSPDRGDTWNRAELPYPIGNLAQIAIAIDPTDNDVLYLSLRGGIAKSEDGGHVWRAINDGLSNTSIALIASHPTDPATLYAASPYGAGAFKSADYGDSWTLLNAGQINELVIDPSQPDTLYQVSGDTQILRSDDGATLRAEPTRLSSSQAQDEAWSVAWPDLRFSSIYALAVAPSISQTLYAHKSGFGLFRSDDGGESWRFLPQSGVDHTCALAVHPDNPNFVLSGETNEPAATSARVHRSKDGGLTWDVALDLPDAAGVTSVAFDPRVEPYFARGKRPADPTRLYAASAGLQGGALWYSNDAGDSWQPLNEALNFANVRTLAVAHQRPGVVYAGVWGGGTWRSDDGGQNWRRVPGDPATSAAAIAIDPNDHNVVYIADETTPHLYRSTDDGHNWELLFDAGTDYDRLAALALAPSDPRILYVSASRSDTPTGDLFRVDTNAPSGENFITITNDLPAAPTSLAIDRYDPGHIFAVVPLAGVWKTVDDGASWRRVQSGLPDVNFTQIVMDPTLPDTLFLAGSHDTPGDPDERDASSPDEVYGIWKSTDNGDTWTQIGGTTLGQASGPIQTITFLPGDQGIMYAASEGGIYLSPDRGQTWTGINGRLPFAHMNAVATDGQTLYAGSAGAGVFAGAIHPLIHTADWDPHNHLAVPIHHVQITLHPTDPQTLYASAFPGGVFKTTDDGATWYARNFGLPSFAVADPTRQGYYALTVAITHPGERDASGPEVLYLGLYGHGVYRNDDGASTWRPIFGDEGELHKANVQTLLVHPDDADIAYAATQGGIWRTINGGDNWGEFSAGLPAGRDGGQVNSDVRTLAWGGEDQLYAGTRGYGPYTRSAFRQIGDDAWRQLAPLGNGETRQRVSLFVHPDDSNTLYAATSPGGLFKTTNDGIVWREHNAGLGNDGALTLALHPTDGTLYAGTTDGIAHSIDGGATWRPRDAGWPPEQQVVSIAFDPSRPEIMYACSTLTVMKSTDGGATWFEITTGLNPDQTFYNVLVDRFEPDIVYLATGQDGIYLSRDGGATWSSWNEGLWNRVAGGRDPTLSGGQVNGDQPARLLRLSADGRLLYFGTAGSGVWRRPAAGAP